MSIAGKAGFSEPSYTRSHPLRARQKLFRRQPEDAAKSPREIEWIAEAQLRSGLFHQHPTVEQKLRSPVHLEVEQVTVGRLVIEALKEPAKI